MKTQPKAAAAKTIDMLILDTLVNDGSRTARELAKTWGEDTTRVLDWLKKFERLGIVRRSGVRGITQSDAYRADKLLVSEYLASRDVASPSS